MIATGKPLIASLVGHVLLVGALIWLVGRTPPLQLPQQMSQNAIEVAFAVPGPPIPPVIEPPPPPIPEPPVVEQTPPPIPEPPPVPVVEAEPPPPPPPKPIVHRPPIRPPVERRVVEQPQRPPPERPPEPRYAPPMQTAALPPMPSPPVAAPSVSPGYVGALRSWLEGHKHYPESAQARGEQGQVVVRLRIARTGRVIDYALVKSSGHPDLDAAVEAMIGGAVLPPFPPEMTQQELPVSIPVNFRLAR